MNALTRFVPMFSRVITVRTLSSVSCIANRTNILYYNMHQYSLPSNNHFNSFSSSCTTNGNKCNNNCHECEHLTECWNCHCFNDCNDRFCHHCHKIQPYIEFTDSTCNYYKMFNLEEKYEIDPKVLLDRYRNLQKKLHPDVYVNKSKKEKDVASAVSSVVNIAYEKLKDPVKRAAYYLFLKSGVNVLSDEKKCSVPPSILMDMLELNENLELCKKPSDYTPYMNAAQKQFDTYEKEYINHIHKQDFDSAQVDVIGMKYYDKAMRDINDKLVPSY